MARTPEPTKLKELKGTADKNVVEPSFPDASIAAPEYLTGDALSMWHEQAPALRSNGLLTVADVALFAEFCQSYAHMRQADRLLNEQGLLVEGRAPGSIVKNPAWQIKRDSAESMLKIGSRFGMTPADRVRLGSPSKMDKDVANLLDEMSELGD